MMTPILYRLLGGIAFISAVFFAGLMTGRGQVQDNWDAAIVKQSLIVAGVKTKQAEATVQVVTEYVDRIQTVRLAGQTIIKEVPVYVPAQADAACSLSRGFVRLHDAAAAGSLPGPASGPDATPAGIALSAVAGTVADNYQRCHENAAQLTALQDWALKQSQIGSE